MLKKLKLLALLALAAFTARMARRALARGSGEYALVMHAMWELSGLIIAAGTAASTAKTRATEARLNALVPRIPVPQSAPAQGSAGGQVSGGNSSYSTANSSFSMAGTVITYNPQASANEGGANSVTSGQIGTGTAHYHSMTHLHTSSVALQDLFNALQGSYSNTVPAVNMLQGSYSTTIANLNKLIADHNTLVADHQTLITTLKATGVVR